MVRKTNRKISAYASADIWTSLRWRKLSAILQRIPHRHVTYTATNCQQAQVPAAPGYRRKSLVSSTHRKPLTKLRSSHNRQTTGSRCQSLLCVCVCGPKSRSQLRKFCMSRVFWRTFSSDLRNGKLVASNKWQLCALRSFILSVCVCVYKQLRVESNHKNYKYISFDYNR